MTADRCTMPTARLTTCRKPATYRYVRDARTRGFQTLPPKTVASYCAQHDRATNHSALLRVRPWEYDRKVRIADGGRIGP
jgi:hypothetical protein